MKTFTRQEKGIESMLTAAALVLAGVLSAQAQRDANVLFEAAGAGISRSGGGLSGFVKSGESPVPLPQAPKRVREYAVNPEQSRLLFSGETPKLSGRFTGFQIQAFGDPAEITAAVINVKIDMTSVQMDSMFVPDSIVREILDTAHYPEATMRTVAVRATPAAGQYSVDVEIVLKGQKYFETIPVEIRLSGVNILVKGTARLQLGPRLAGTVKFDSVLVPVN